MGFRATSRRRCELTVYATEFGGAPEIAVWFDVADPELLRRTRNRAIAEGRVDDVDVVARHRIDVYNAATAPLVDHYRELGMLIRVDAGRPVDEVTATVLDHLRPFATDAG